MGSDRRTANHFRKRLKHERGRRGWSQEDMAKLLSDNGIPMYATTVAKIEAGDRAVRIDEASGIADALELSVDTLLGRRGEEDDGVRAMEVLAGEALQLVSEVVNISGRLREAYRELEAQFGLENFERLIANGHSWSLDGLDVDTQRAMLMWASRDLAMHELHKMMQGLANIVAFRSMSPRQLSNAAAEIQARAQEYAIERRETSDGSQA